MDDQHWFGLPIENYVIYELHVGTFTPEGTFEAVIPYLDESGDTRHNGHRNHAGRQFPGSPNWGYDGVFPFAVQNSYGGPCGLKKLVDAMSCAWSGGNSGRGLQPHRSRRKLSLEFAPYFTDQYKTPWGSALNFDDAHSDEVRHFFISNAIEWITDYHFDALRLDAVHAILDHSALNFLEELRRCGP